jgi:16S rRNA (uracil1498-N3)-methyltransferase
MTPPLFLLPGLPDGLTTGGQILLDGDEGRHASTAKRLSVGEVVLIGDGQGTVCECTVVAVRGASLDLEVTLRRFQTPAAPRLVVVQAVPKGERAELAVELLTELGADEILPWAAARSIVRWDEQRGAKAVERWRRTAREATKQSRRAWLPVIGPLASTSDVAARLTAARGLVLHEGASAGIAAVPVAAEGEIVLVVGPEGGITDGELAAFAAAGATAVRLGEPVQRSSTAGGAALAALNVALGRWN